MIEDANPAAGMVRLSHYCGECGYPIDDGICPECGGRPVPRKTLIERRRTLGRLLRLIAFGWGTKLVAFVLMTLPLVIPGLAPGMGGPVRGFVGFVQVLFFVAAVSVGLAAIAIAKGPWALSSTMKTLLRIAAVGFFVDAFRRILTVLMLMVPAPPAILLYEWSEWPASILGMFAILVLLRTIGICSWHDPGGRERPFLRHAWIVYAVCLTPPVAVTAAYFFLPIDGQGGLMALLQLGLFVRIVILITVVGFMIPWKRMLTRCAEINLEAHA